MSGIFTQAETVATQSNCIRRQVGAILIDPAGKAISFGFNHVFGVPDCSDKCPRAKRSYDEVPALSSYTQPGQVCYAMHAEIHALNKVRDLPPGCKMVVSTRPCPQCQDRLDSAGVIAIWPDET